MPELPEVETMRRGILPIVGSRVEDVRRARCTKRPILVAPRLDVFRRRAVGHSVTAVDRAGKRAFLESLHMLCVPTVYPEAKGLYLLEAMDAGVPVVQPRAGSFPELIEATGGGVLFEPNTPESLADALANLLDHDEDRVAMGRRGQARVRELFTAGVMARETWAVLEQCCGL